MTSEREQAAEPTDRFPVAEVQTRGTASVFVSKMWWLTLVCAIVAAGLAWQSMPARGPVISISLPQGHGLKPGDALRHRGIDVGTVQTVALTSDLSGIMVHVELRPEAEVLCREGSRFWVVRPRVALTGIEGLETVVGARYIAVSPGPADAAEQRQFDGLASSPPDEFAGDGLKLILRAETRGGLNPGAPVTWKGVQVGQVLSVGLAPDARHVNASVRIHGRYRRLVTSASRFWVSSGIGVHIGLSGIDLNAESLASLALGGISFITPATDEPSASVSNGHVFPLHPEVNSEWLSNVAAIPMIDFDLPETVTVEGEVVSSILGIRRRHPFSTSGLLLKRDEGVSLLTAGIPLVSTDEGQQRPELQISTPGQPNRVTLAAATAPESPGVMLVSLPAEESTALKSQAWRLRTASAPEACCVTRSVISDGHLTSLIHTIGEEQLTVREDQWIVTDTDETDLSAWNGSPVLSLSDGSVIGALTATEQGTAVLPIPDSDEPSNAATSP